MKQMLGTTGRYQCLVQFFFFAFCIKQISLLNHLPPFHPIHDIFFRHTNPLNTLSYKTPPNPTGSR